MNKSKMLIEVAMPVKEISAESVRDKSIRHGHISTLHLWWARRPLPVCRAVVFASLVPDPLDTHCPEQFNEAVNELLGAKNNPGDPYKPYEDIPFTTAIDPMEDNLRNRLLMFIGKFSHKYVQNEKIRKNTSGNEQLSEFCLIKWENKDKEKVINKARKLIWVAHDPENNTLTEFDKYYHEIKEAEKVLYSTVNRHLDTVETQNLESQLQTAIDNFLDRMPKVFDPFAGGGAIPLEAARLGCRSFGNDINPVTYVIQKGSLEYPQKYGKPITYTKDEFLKIYGEEEYNRVAKDDPTFLQGNEIKISNRLYFDFEYYANKLLKTVENETKYLYPEDEKGNKSLAYFWARVATCSNPSCKAEVPLLGQFYLSKRRNTSSENWIYLSPVIKGNNITFTIAKGTCKDEEWVKNKKLNCPICKNITDKSDLKKQFIENKTSEVLLAVLTENENGRLYRSPFHNEQTIINEIETIEVPEEKITPNDSRNLWLTFWGITKWGETFSKRQAFFINNLVKNLNKLKERLNFSDNDYKNAIIVYLSILIDKIVARNSSFCVWHILQETIEHPFGRQALPMAFDFPEMNPFGSLSSNVFGQMPSILNYIENESQNFNNSFLLEDLNFTLANEKFFDYVVTDPPYYDSIAYADLSDFFYVWLKRCLASIFPVKFAFPLTPKTEECTALKHHHDNNEEKAKQHFENKLLEIFTSIEKRTSNVVSIMFAHQSTEAWTTLVNSILNANMNITGSWAISTEVTGALKNDKAYLASSVTVSCRPSIKSGYGDFKEIKSAIEQRVKEEVKLLYKLGFRGADLLTACFGQAVSEFGKYKKVEKADGTEVTVAELLELSREAAFNAIISDIDTDDITRFYIGWLNLFGFTETDHDSVRRITQIGLSVDASELLAKDILIRSGNKESLADYKQRITANSKLGEHANSCMIDRVHKAMYLFGNANRGTLLNFIGKYANSPENNFWRVLNSLGEILPIGIDDQKQVAGLIVNKDSLIREAQQVSQSVEQTRLELGI